MLAAMDTCCGYLQALLDRLTSNGKAQTLYTLDRYHEACVTYDRVIQLAPDYAAAYRGRGFTLLYLQRYQEAIEAFIVL